MGKFCHKVLEDFHNAYINGSSKPLNVEMGTAYKSALSEFVPNLILNGMIDRVQLDADNVIHVCDYKTVKNKKYLKNDFFQLLTYAYVIVNEDPSIKKVRASYILLRYDFEYITTEFEIDEILKVKDKYVEYARQMNLETEFLPNPTVLCRYCDYAPLCPEGKKMLEPSKVYGEVTW